jgi:hypothetical protein
LAWQAGHHHFHDFWHYYCVYDLLSVLTNILMLLGGDFVVKFSQLVFKQSKWCRRNDLKILKASDQNTNIRQLVTVNNFYLRAWFLCFYQLTLGKSFPRSLSQRRNHFGTHWVNAEILELWTSRPDRILFSLKSRVPVPYKIWSMQKHKKYLILVYL